MKHLKSFNESDVSFKNDDDDIKLFFTDYTDDNPESLTIQDGLVYDGRFIEDTSYIKDPSKYRRAKLVTLTVSKPDGINVHTGKCLTDIETLSNLLSDIKRFYELSGEDVNYKINTDFLGLSVKFITLGDMVNQEESQSDKIDEYLKRIGELIKKKGHKRQTIKGNFLDMRFAKKGDFDIAISRKLRRIGTGEFNLDNTNDNIDRELITIRNEAWNDNLKFYISGGDQQVVLKLVKRG